MKADKVTLRKTHAAASYVDIHEIIYTDHLNETDEKPSHLHKQTQSDSGQEARDKTRRLKPFGTL